MRFKRVQKKESNFWILVIELSEQPTDLLVRSTNEFCLNQILLCIFFSSLRNKSDWIKWKAPGRIYPVLADPYVSTNISLSRGLFKQNPFINSSKRWSRQKAWEPIANCITATVTKERNSCRLTFLLLKCRRPKHDSPAIKTLRFLPLHG